MRPSGGVMVLRELQGIEAQVPGREIYSTIRPAGAYSRVRSRGSDAILTERRTFASALNRRTNAGTAGVGKRGDRAGYVDTDSFTGDRVCRRVVPHPRARTESQPHRAR